MNVVLRPISISPWRQASVVLFLLAAGALVEPVLAQRPRAPRRPRPTEFAPDTQQLEKMPPQENTPAERVWPGQVQQLEGLNLQFQLPHHPWVQVDPRQLNPVACLMFIRSEPDVGVVIVGENLGVATQLDNESLVAILQAQFRSKMPNATIWGQREESCGELRGITYEASLPEQDMYWVNWCGWHNGYAYQIITFGAPDHAAEVMEASRDFRDRLRQIDSSSVSNVTNQQAVSRFESKAFGYELDLTGLGWIRMNEGDENFPGSEFAAYHSCGGGLMVLPVPMPNRPPDLALLTKIFLERSSAAQGGFDITGMTPCRHAGLVGQDVEARAADNGKPMRYRLRVLADDRCAYFVFCWVLSQQDDRTDEMLHSVERFELVSRQAAVSQPASAKHCELCAVLLNQIGIQYFGRGDLVSALDYFASSIDFSTADEVVVANYLEVLSQLDRHDEALAYLNEHLSKTSGSLQLRAWRAGLISKSGDDGAAREMYADVFAAGYTEEAALLHYIDLCIEAKAYEDAIAAVEAVQERKPTLVVQRWHAGLYASKGDYAKSIAMIEALRTRYPSSQDVAVDLASVHEQAESFVEGLEITQELLAAGKEDVRTLLTHGRLQLHLDRSGEAKQSFERVLELQPQNEDARELLKIASSHLGEGDNSCLKTPIKAVEIPSVVRAAMGKNEGRSDANSKHGAEVLSHVVGMSFAPGAALRTTVSRRVKVYSAGGVSRFSTLSFALKPTKERFYVNQLVVLNEQNERVAEGSIENYYVVDDHSSGVASNSQVVNLPVPGLKPGYTLEFTVTREDYGAATEFPFQQICLSSHSPVRMSAFFIHGDVGQLRWSASTSLKVQSTNDTLYCVEPNPTLICYEPHQPSMESFVPTLWVGGPGATWEAEGRSYLELIQNKLAVDEKARQLAAELTRDCRTNREKLAAISAHVQQAYTYQAIEFGRRARVPNSARKTIELKYGDCKDHSLLVKQLLEGVGITSHLALVNASGELVEELPSLDQFDHVVVYVPNSAIGDDSNAWGGFVIDATNKDADPLAVPPHGMGDKPILVLDPAGPRIVRTPSYPSDGGRLISQRHVTLRIDASRGTAVDADVYEQVTFNSYLAPAVRSYLKSFEPGERREAIQNLLSGKEQFRVKRVEAEHLDDPSQPLVLSLEYVMPGLIHCVNTAAENRSLVGNLPCAWENLYVQTDYLDDRATPFEITVPKFIQASVQVELPAGYQLADLARFSGSGRSKFAAWKSSATQRGNEISMEYGLRLAAGRHAAKVYTNYYAAMSDSLAVLQGPVTLHDSMVRTAVPPGANRIPR